MIHVVYQQPSIRFSFGKNKQLKTCILYYASNFIYFVSAQRAFMKNITGRGQLLIILTVFIVSRLIVAAMGIHLDMRALYAYWQYLDIETLRNHLLTGIWYDHAQPPVFNLLIGFILKIGGSHYIPLFTFLFEMISLGNILLLFSIIKKLSRVYFLPILIALAYMLSPATLIFETELFYTIFVSFLLLLSVFYLIRLSDV